MNITLLPTVNALNAAVLVITVNGSIDAVTAPQLDESLKSAFTEGSPNIAIFQMEGVDYVSSAGLRSVLGVAKILRKRKGHLIFVGLAPTVREVFDLSGFMAYCKEFATIEEALAAT